MSDRSGSNWTECALFRSALPVALGVTMGAGGMTQAAAPAGTSPMPRPSQAEQSATQSQAVNALVRLLEAFTSAQQAFDAGKLATLTTPDYVEISPVGEVDSREKMLSFYAPDRKTAAPDLAISDVAVRTFGDAAVAIARIAYTAQRPGQPIRTTELRASFVAHRLSGEWKIASAHYTGIRPSGR